MNHLRYPASTRSEQRYKGKRAGNNFLFSTLLFFLLLWPVQGLAKSQQSIHFDISSTSLSLAIVEFGRQSGTPIAIIGEAPPLIRTPAVRGTMTPDAALKMLLESSGYRFRRSSRNGYVLERIRLTRPVVTVAAPVRAKLPKKVKAAPVAGSAADDAHDMDIIVTATKSDTPLSRYAGSVYVSSLEDPRPRISAGHGSDILVDSFPVLTATTLGSGRNKLFGRNVAESSLSGWAQTGLATYLGEQRLGYTAPDPNLQLLDMQRVELMLGPYGTLYGAGAIGGILRLVPNKPDPTQFAGSVKNDMSFVKKGGVGGLLSGMINVPIIEDHLAMRALIYRNVDAGYIDNIVLRKKDANRQETRGGRWMLRWQPDEEWTIDTTLLHQNVKAEAPPYADYLEVQTTIPFLQITHSPFDALTTYKKDHQPFDSHFTLANLTVEKFFGDVKMMSSTGWTHQKSDDEYSYGLVIYVDLLRDYKMWNHETRFSGQWNNTSVIAGMSAARSDASQDVTINYRYPALGNQPPQSFSYPNMIIAKTREIAAFTEIEQKIGSSIRVKLGGRLAHVKEKRSFEAYDITFPTATKKRTWSFSPSASVTWDVSRGHLFYVAYRHGYRSAGDQPEVKQIDPRSIGENFAEIAIPQDKLRLIEGGYRATLGQKIQLSINGYHTKWNNIQRDVPDTAFAGVAITTSGDTEFWGGDISVNWRPTSRLSLDAALTLSENATYLFSYPLRPRLFNRKLPNTTTNSGRLAARYDWPLTPDMNLRLGAAFRHYGKTESDVSIPVPAYHEMGAEAQLSWKQFKWGVMVSNLLNGSSNRYAFGHPFEQTIAPRDLYTVQQPRTIFLSMGADF